MQPRDQNLVFSVYSVVYWTGSHSFKMHFLEKNWIVETEKEQMARTSDSFP